MIYNMQLFIWGNLGKNKTLLCFESAVLHFLFKVSSFFL